MQDVVSPFVIVSAAFALRIIVILGAGYAIKYEKTAILLVFDRLFVSLVVVGDGERVVLLRELNPSITCIDDTARSASRAAAPTYNSVVAGEIDAAFKPLAKTRTKRACPGAPPEIDSLGLSRLDLGRIAFESWNPAILSQRPDRKDPDRKGQENRPFHKRQFSHFRPETKNGERDVNARRPCSWSRSYICPSSAEGP